MRSGVLFAVLASWVLCEVVIADERPRPPLRIREDAELVIERAGEAGLDQAGILIEASAPIQNLFARAEEGLGRRDWKFVIDCLQRIIDDPEDSLVPRGDGAVELGVLYESVRRQAVRMLTTLPPDGIRAYRLLYDGKAKGLFVRGRERHDASLVRQVVDRYLLTDHGDDAADLLASWALDEGRPGEAVVLLSDLLDLRPEGDVPRHLVASKLAAAYVLLGRAEQAERVVSRFADEVSSPPDWLLALGDPERGRSMLGMDIASLDPGGTASPHDPSRRAGTGDQTAAALSPALVDPLPWRYGLGGDAVGTWRHIGDFGAGGPVVLPVMAPVLAGGRLFARTPGGCVALDESDLGLLWRSSAEEPVRADDLLPTSGQNGESPSGGPWEGDAPYEDFVGGSLAVAHGLVLTIEEPVGPPALRARRRGRTAVEFGPLPDRLVARDAVTGAMRWQRGATGDPSDPLAGAVFRDVPVAVGKTLWVPYSFQNDLFVAVLEPADGSPVHRIGLGSLPRTEVGAARSARSTPLAAADGVVYVPSGEGVVFAVDAADYHVRWAHAYMQPKEETPREFVFRQAQQHRREPIPVPITDEEHRFLPSAPVASGGLVIVAPRDSGQVLAFSAAGGEFRWAVPGEQWSYLIGADAQRVWLGGHAVSCLSLSDGATLWSVPLSAAPTGRAAMCGETIQVPLAEGLWTLDAGTGEVIRRQAMPPSQVPLGNVACSETALFSIEPSSVRKLPDIERTIAWARERRAANAGDVRALCELAWMYLLRKEPESAYGLLRDDNALADAGERAARALTRIRIEALLAMAGRDEATADEALAWLTEARDQATTPGERLRCSLAIADRQQATGDAAGAFETLLAAGMSADADHLVDLGELVTASARVAIGQRLRHLGPELSNPQRGQLAARTQAELAHAADVLKQAASDPHAWAMNEEARAATAVLRAAGDLLRHEPAGAAALLALADWEVSRFAYERAEQLLFEVLEGGNDDRSMLAAHMRLCTLYTDPAYEGAGLLGLCLDSLDERFGGSAVPKEYPAPVPEGLAPRLVENVRSWVDWVRSQRPASGTSGALDINVATGFEAADAPSISFAQQVDPLWTLYFAGTRADDEPSAPFTATGELRQLIDHAAPMGPPRLVRLDGALWPGAGPGAAFSTERVNQALSDSRVLLHAPDDLLLCLKPLTGELLWHAALSLPDKVEESFAPVQWDPGANRRRAVCDGQTAVFNTSSGLYAAGLVTGRRLWVRACESTASPDAVSEVDMRMAVGRGLLAAVRRAGHLTLMRLYDGSVLWERDLRGEPVDRIDVVGDRVVTQDRDRQRVHIFDVNDGRLVRQVLFRQPDLRSGVVSLPILMSDDGAVAGSRLCGPDSDATAEQVVGIDVQTGEELWRLDLDKPLVQLFQPEAGYLGMGLVGGDVRVVDAGSGELLLDRRIASVHAVIDGHMHDGTFVVQAVDARRQRWEPVLVGMDIATDRELWRRDDLSAQGWSELAFRITNGVAPSLVEFSSSDAARNRQVGLALVGARTGENQGGVFDLTPTRSRNVYNGAFEAHRDAIVVGTGAGVEALPVIGITDPVEEN